jgi:hypothetical protein
MTKITANFTQARTKAGRQVTVVWSTDDSSINSEIGAPVTKTKTYPLNYSRKQILKEFKGHVTNVIEEIRNTDMENTVEFEV